MDTLDPTSIAPPACSPREPAAGSGRRALLRQYAWVQLFWNPLVCFVAVLALGSGPTFGRSFALALVVALVTSSVCFVPVAALLEFDQRLRSHARTLEPRGRGFYLGVALMGMPFGLILASHVTRLLFGETVPGSAYEVRFALTLGLLLAGLFSAWQSRADARRARLALELRLERAETHRLQAQLAALTAQLNPHLMFNALNTIAELVQSNATLAERMVLRLSDLYRGVLRATQRDQHSLAEELELCEAYLDLERSRFGDRLRTQVDVAAGVDPRLVQVPVLVLQPLVENAVLHGLLDRARGGSVSIAVRASGSQLALEVRDDGVGLGRSSRSGSGLGIENTRRRLELRYGQRARLELASPGPGGTVATLRLPFQLA